MGDSRLIHNIMSGRAGWWATPLRGALRCIESVYSTGLAIRNRRYDRSSACASSSIPVISVGNITVGGTGKTPLVIDLVTRLDRLGRSPAVLARGYGSPVDEPNDEERLIRRYCPSAIYIADPNRVRAADRAARQLGADVAVLDDGFQHRRLARNLDIVLIDATCPFGYNHVLPRGLLREPLIGLRRAGLFVVTRCDQVSANALARVEAELRRIADDVPIIRCLHRVASIEPLGGGDSIPDIAGRRVILFASIGRPAAFATTVASLGAAIVATHWWPDHYHYRSRDVRELVARHRRLPHDLLLTTEKDAVKLTDLKGIDSSSIAVVRVAIEFVADGGTILQRKLENVLRQAKGMNGKPPRTTG